MLTGISRTNFPAFKLDPRPQTGSPALSSPLTAPNDGFYTPVNYRGAFAAMNWAADWTFAGASGLMSGEGAGTPLAAPGAVAPPEITAQPVSQASQTGGSVTLSVEATGGALSYQWYKDGVLIDGATESSYTIASVNTSSAGAYTVVVMNSLGEATSSTAVVSATDIALYAGVLVAGPINQQYEIQYTTSLDEPVTWTPLTTITLTSSPLLYVDTSVTANSQPHRYYRAVPMGN
jgi:hypothetical protein